MKQQAWGFAASCSDNNHEGWRYWSTTRLPAGRRFVLHPMGKQRRKARSHRKWPDQSQHDRQGFEWRRLGRHQDSVNSRQFYCANGRIDFRQNSHRLAFQSRQSFAPLRFRWWQAR